MKKEEQDPICFGLSLLQPKKRIVLIGQAASSTPIEVQLEEHNRQVCRPGRRRRCYREFCARCDAVAWFSPHDVRPRGLRIIVGRCVLCRTVWLARWRCRTCRLVFTDYPDFRTPVQALRRTVAAGARTELLGEGSPIVPANGAIRSDDHRLWNRSSVGGI